MRTGPKHTLINHCCVMGCPNTIKSRKYKEFHLYSIRPVKKRIKERFALWVEALQLTGMSSEFIERSVVCSDHFDTNDFEESDLLGNRLMGGKGTYKKTPRLKETAVPHLNLNQSQTESDGMRLLYLARNQSSNQPTKNAMETRKRKYGETGDSTLFEFVPMESLPDTIKVELLDEDIKQEPIEIEVQPMEAEIQTQAVEDITTSESTANSDVGDPDMVSPLNLNQHKPSSQQLTQNLSKFELAYKNHMMEGCCTEYDGPRVYRYFCPFCFHVFPDSDPFIIHLGIESPVSSRFLAIHRISVRCDCMVTCHFCSTIYDSILTYQTHVENAMGDSKHDFGRHVCTVCNSKFKSLCGLNRHNKQIHNNPVFHRQCRLCDTQFPNDLTFEVHKTLCHRDMYHCVTCDNYFTTHMDSDEHKNDNPSHVTGILTDFVYTMAVSHDDLENNRPDLQSNLKRTITNNVKRLLDGSKDNPESVKALPDGLQNNSKHDTNSAPILSTRMPLKNNPQYDHESGKMLQNYSENLTIVEMPRLNEESASMSSTVHLLPLKKNPQFDHENVTIIQVSDLDFEEIIESSTTQTSPINFSDLPETVTTFENTPYSGELVSHTIEDLFLKFKSLNRCENNETSYYVCPYCCMIFETKIGFLFHIGVVIEDKKSETFTEAHLVPLNISCLKCVYCEIVTSLDQETYHSHLNIKHLQETIYQCPECNAKFSFICELNKHKMSCVKLSQFLSCNNCKATFQNIPDFWSHERKCVDCKEQFETRDRLESHQCKKQDDDCVLIPIKTPPTNSDLKITDFVKCNKCMSATVCPLLQKLNSTFVARNKS